MLKLNDKRILVIPDLQIPFHHRDSFAFLAHAHNTYECDTVICIGDEVDQYNLSRYDKDPDAIAAGEELKLSRRYLRELYALFPEVKSCMSNHMERIFKSALRAGIPKGYLKSVNQFMDAPDGWSWHDYIDIDGIRFEHGDASGGQRAHRILAEANRKSTVIGHNHSYAGVDYISNGSEVIFGMNVGCLVDFKSYAFSYGQKKKHKPVLSCGVVLNGIPAVVPMLTNSRGRWTRCLPL